jgi:NAD(P)H-dependent FMN reductase
LTLNQNLNYAKKMKSKITILNFSLRENSVASSYKVAKYIQNEWGQDANLINYLDLNLPLWDEKVWQGDETWNKKLTPLKEKLSNTDGLIFVVPEYAGSASPALANFLLFVSNGKTIAHTPTLIITVSNARGGSYVVSQMRGFSFKNAKQNYLPEHIIVRDSNQVLNEVIGTIESGDPYIRERLSYTLEILDIYSRNFKQIKSEISNLPGFLNPKFTNGM